MSKVSCCSGVVKMETKKAPDSACKCGPKCGCDAGGKCLPEKCGGTSPNDPCNCCDTPKDKCCNCCDDCDTAKCGDDCC